MGQPEEFTVSGVINLRCRAEPTGKTRCGPVRYAAYVYYWNSHYSCLPGLTASAGRFEEKSSKCGILRKPRDRKIDKVPFKCLQGKLGEGVRVNILMAGEGEEGVDCDIIIGYRVLLL